MRRHECCAEFSGDCAPGRRRGVPGSHPRRMGAAGFACCGGKSRPDTQAPRRLSGRSRDIAWRTRDARRRERPIYAEGGDWGAELGRKGGGGSGPKAMLTGTARAAQAARRGDAAAPRLSNSRGSILEVTTSGHRAASHLRTRGSAARGGAGAGSVSVGWRRVFSCALLSWAGRGLSRACLTRRRYSMPSIGGPWGAIGYVSVS